MQAPTRISDRRGSSERFETVIVGGGQAGLAMGHHLARNGRPFVILDAEERIGEAWRRRWDSLRLFTPAWLNGLPGRPFPAPAHHFPTKDAMADFLEAYAAHFQLPVRNRTRVERLERQGQRFRLTAGGARYEADNVVIAMGTYQRPKLPPFAGELDPEIIQLHARDYRKPEQLREGSVLVVGAGNSGAEIAIELAPRMPTVLAGRHPGHVPFRIEGAAARAFLLRFLLRFVFHRLLTTSTPMGRALRPKVLEGAGPLIRQKPRDLDAAGVTRAPRVTGVVDGRPRLEDGRVLDVANVVWCTGFRPDYAWVDLPGIVPADAPPNHHRGVVPEAPGLYLLGLHFLHALSSGMIQGLDRDAAHLAHHIVARSAAQAHATAPAVPSGART